MCISNNVCLITQIKKNDFSLYQMRVINFCQLRAWEKVKVLNTECKFRRWYTILPKWWKLILVSTKRGYFTNANSKYLKEVHGQL